MRLRAPALLLASLAACAISPAVASADSPLPYSAQVTAEQLAAFTDAGFDVGELGYDPSDGGRQEVQFVATKADLAHLEREGISAAPLPLERPAAKSKAVGSGPNQFFNVYRSYM